MAEYTVIDSFAGAGGLALGFHLEGFRLGAAFDADASAVSTFQRNLGERIIRADVHDLSGRDLLDLASLLPGECNVLCGGPPCQGFSMQRRGPDEDQRNDLLFEFVRLVEEVLPTMVLMENVPGLAGRRGQDYLGEIRWRLRRAGFRCYAQVLLAADFGVPQMRRRFFLVAEKDDGLEHFRFPTPTHSPDCYVTVRDAIGDLPDPFQQPDRAASVPNHEQDHISEKNRQRIAHVPQGGGRADIPEHLRLPCHRQAPVARAGHRSVYGRLHWEQPAGTITTKCNSFTRGRFAHPTENRNITMREAARLQSFPDDFVFCGDKVAQAHQIGNAVPPLLARHLASAILEALEARKAGEGWLPASEEQQQLRLASL